MRINSIRENWNEKQVHTQEKPGIPFHPLSSHLTWREVTINHRRILDLEKKVSVWPCNLPFEQRRKNPFYGTHTGRRPGLSVCLIRFSPTPVAKENPQEPVPTFRSETFIKDDTFAHLLKAVLQNEWCPSWCPLVSLSMTANTLFPITGLIPPSRIDAIFIFHRPSRSSVFAGFAFATELDFSLQQAGSEKFPKPHTNKLNLPTEDPDGALFLRNFALWSRGSR